MMPGKTAAMAQEFARMVLRAWRDGTKPCKILVLLACGCHASFEVGGWQGQYVFDLLVEGYLNLFRNHVCPATNQPTLTEHDKLVLELAERPPWQDV